MKIIKYILPIALFLSTVGCFAQVDEDCLCVPYPFMEENLNGEAIDTCYVKEILELDIDGLNCEEIFEKHKVYFTNSNNRNSEYIYTKSAFNISFDKQLFNKSFIKGDNILIEDFNEEYEEIKEKFVLLEEKFGLFRIEFHSYTPHTNRGSAKLHFNNYLPFSKITPFMEKNFINGTTINFELMTFEELLNIEIDNFKPNYYSFLDNKLVSKNEIIKSVEIYNIYGNLVLKQIEINSYNFTLNLEPNYYILKINTKHNSTILKLVSH